MNEDLARAIAAGSIGLTVFGIGVAVLFSTREARVRVPVDLLMVLLTAGALAGVAVVTGVHTDPVLAGGAGLLGASLGAAQGSQLRVRRDGGRVFSRRGAIALAAWGVGLITIQAASLVSREGVVEIGQAVSYFGVGGAFGLIVGRESAIRRLAPIGAAVIALTSVLALLPAPNAARAQDPETVELTIAVDTAALANALANPESGFSPGVATQSEVIIRFSTAGGPATGGGDLVVEEFPLGELFHVFELLAESIGDGIGDAIGGAVGGTGGSSDSSDRPIRPELATCRSDFGLRTVLEGSFDPASATLSGPATGTLYFDNLSGCPADVGAGELTSLPGDWNGTYIDGVLTGELRIHGEEEGIVLTFPLEASTEPEPTPSTEAAAAAENPEPTAPAEDPDGDDRPTPVIAPPVSIDEIEPNEAAATGIIAAGAAGLVGLISAATAVASAPTHPMPGLREDEQAPDGGFDDIGDISEFDRPKVQPAAISPEDIDRAAANIARMAESGGYGDILAAIQNRVESGNLDPKTLETLRQILKDRMDLDGAIASSDLMNRSDFQTFLDGYRSDLAGWADWLVPGSGLVLRDPVLVARIIAAIHTGGATELVLTPLDILGKVVGAATTPGEDLTNAGALAEMGGIIAVEGAKEVATDLLMGGAGKLAGAAIDAVKGARGIDLSAAAKGLPGGTTGDALEAGARGNLPAKAPDIDDFRPKDMPNSAVTRDATGPPAPAGRPGSPELPRTDAPSPRGDTSFDPDYRPGTQSIVPKADDTFLREAPNGTKLTGDQLPATGYTPGQIEDIRKIASENDVLIGTRATNPASAHHLEKGTAVPKPLEVKQKTTNPIDLQIGGRPENEGLVSVFKPTEPRPQDFRNPAEYQKAVERFVTRADEYKKTMEKLPELKDNYGITWDESTGLLKNADGKPFAGDIDGVYVKDAKTGHHLGPGNPTYDRVMQQMADSRVQGQHGFEGGMVVDIAGMKGPAAIPDAMNAHTALSQNHERGAEILIEIGADGAQKGPRPFGMYDRLHPDQSSLQRGIPMALPE